MEEFHKVREIDDGDNDDSKVEVAGIIRGQSVSDEAKDSARPHENGEKVSHMQQIFQKWIHSFLLGQLVLSVD